MEAERSIRMYKSRGWSCKGVTVTEKICGSPAMQEGEEGDVAMVMMKDVATMEPSSYYDFRHPRV